MNILKLIRAKFTPVLTELGVDAGKLPDFLAMIKPAQDAKKGDYQANLAMPLAKQLGRKPPELAADIVAGLDLGDLLQTPEVAGPGFINLRIQPSWLAAQLQTVARDDRLGVASAETPRTFVIDFSSPNVAKPLHVGHLRSTIIGEALARILRFMGHQVIADNHLGDWGTQFGILLYGYKNHLNEQVFAEDPVRELARLYVDVRKMFRKASDEDEGAADDPIASACRQETAKLHAGDEENLKLWQAFMPHCLEEIHHIYRRLDVHFDHEYGESHYQPMLAEVVQDLQAAGIAQESRGALIFIGSDESVSVIRKGDGAYTYTTTDLATVRYRMRHWQPDAMLYVVDFRQGGHFKNVFEAAKRWGYDQVELTHISFGSVLGEDKRPLKTRDGSAIELEGLLDRAVELGRQKYEESLRERQSRNEEVPDLAPEEIEQIAEMVGLGAVKYADLSQHRTSDYVFSYEKMLATDGNTATYMQYAHARCRSIFRKGDEDPAKFQTDPPKAILDTPQEQQLALQLLRFEEALELASTEYLPHLLTSYLWDLAKTYSGFFVQCPVLKAETVDLRASRLLLCDLTARTIRQTLALLGIRAPERM